MSDGAEVGMGDGDTLGVKNGGIADGSADGSVDGSSKGTLDRTRDGAVVGDNEGLQFVAAMMHSMGLEMEWMLVQMMILLME